MKRREAATDRQQEVLDFINSYATAHGYPPTLREIGKGLGIQSTNGVTDHLKALEKKGYVQRTKLHSRGIVLVQEQPVRACGAPGAPPPPGAAVEEAVQETARLRQQLMAELARLEGLGSEIVEKIELHEKGHGAKARTSLTFLRRVLA